MINSRCFGKVAVDSNLPGGIQYLLCSSPLCTNILRIIRQNSTSWYSQLYDSSLLKLFVPSIQFSYIAPGFPDFHLLLSLALRLNLFEFLPAFLRGSIDNALL